MGAHKSLSTEADYASVLRTANRFKAEADQLRGLNAELVAALKDLPNILAEIHHEWDRGMKAGKLLIALMDPSLKYRADVTRIHDALAKADR